MDREQRKVKSFFTISKRLQVDCKLSSFENPISRIKPADNAVQGKTLLIPKNGSQSPHRGKSA